MIHALSCGPLRESEQHTGVPKDQWRVDTLDKNGNPMYL